MAVLIVLALVKTLCYWKQQLLQVETMGEGDCGGNCNKRILVAAQWLCGGQDGGIRTFRDDDELERGDHIASKLIKTIDESRISIIVFSKDYASSTWCLNELLRILERRSVGHLIVPVFYHVDPSDLRWLKGSFGDAFAKHEERLKSKSDEEKEEGMVKIRSWRKALEEVAGLSAHVLGKDENESDFIQQKIIKDIGNKLGCRTVLSVCRYPVGLDSRIKSINLWLQDGSSKVSIMAIYGIGGIGKTTIAKTVYNKNFDNFEGSSFLADIRETSKQQNGLVYLHRQLLSNILKGREVKISNVHEGNKMIEEALTSKRVLLVLDDVDQSELFSWHVFGQYHPSEAYKEHSKRVVKYCEGLPLDLEVLGSSLSKRDADIWEDVINKLEAVPNSQIIEKLKISFDLLEDDCDRKIFLNIACFFVGKDKDLVIKVLDACELHPIVGIDNLIKRCLLTVDDAWSKKLRMHRLLQEMGRKIVRLPESPTDPWKGSRLWHHKDALNGTEVIEGLTLNLHRSISSEQSGQGFSTSERRRLSIFSWIPGTSASTESSSTSNEVDLHTDAFSSMHNLRLLQLNNVRLTGNYEQFPKELRWLCWCWFPLKIIPSEFYLESLVVLEMKCSSLKQVWKGKKSLKSLKILNFSHSHDLIETPDFSNVPNLESLILEDCITLIKAHESIGELK
ncbi:disease resistance protein RUN1-like [Cornus florida]|uniref:disease resistance protein RUN1-like n=1 Tax=Cornus florida TaxID=4283 RepID=UPI00289A7F7C|nr:disease resistance protein RUN1-like [Cornus florida]